MRRLKLVVADDHGLMIEAVRIALDDDPDFEIVGVAETGSQVLPVVRQTEPDLVVLDLRMPGMDGLTCIKLLREQFPALRVAVLSGIDSDEIVEEVIRLGASAFISKRVDPEELPRALRAAFEATVSEPIAWAEATQAPAVRTAGLTERELEILRALGQGHANKVIAANLWLAEQTVKFHLTNIYRKLNVSSRTEAVQWAYRHGVLDPAAGAELDNLLRTSSGRE